MPTTLKMSDNVYWDGDSILTKDRGDKKYRTLSVAWRDMEWGKTAATNLSGATGVTNINVTFSHTFKAAPIVMVGHATNGASTTYRFGRSFIEVTNVTTTGFTIKLHAQGVGSTSNWQFAWLAVSNNVLTPTTTHTDLMLSDSLAWDYSGIALNSSSSYLKTTTVLSNIKRPLIIAGYIGSLGGFDVTNVKPGNGYERTFNFATVTKCTKKFKTAPVVIIKESPGSNPVGTVTGLASSRASQGYTVRSTTTTGFTVSTSNDNVATSGSGINYGPAINFIAIGEENI